MWSFRAWRRRRILARSPYTTQQWHSARARLPILDGLSEAEEQRLFQRAVLFLHHKHLTALPGIRVLRPRAGLRYLHLLFDRHQLVLSNCIWSESLLTGPQALQSLSAAARREIRALLPDMPQDPARRLTNGRQGRKLIERHLRNDRAFLPV